MAAQLAAIGAPLYNAANYDDLQAAIDACPDGATLFVPHGVYVIDTTYAYTCPTTVVAHPDYGATLYGLKVFGKRVNLVGEGYGTQILTGANNVRLISYWGTDYNDTRADHCTVSNLRLVNYTPYYTGTRGVSINYCGQTKVVNCAIEDFKVAGVYIQGANICQVVDCNTRGCEVGIVNNVDVDVSGAGSHALQVRGGDISAGGGNGGRHYGIRTNCQRVSAHGVTIQGMITAGIEVTGFAYGLTALGCYWEQVDAGGYDVVLNQFRNAIIQNASSVYARSGESLTLENFWDQSSPASVGLNVDSTVANLLILNPWQQAGEDNSTDNPARQQIRDLVDQGVARVINAGAAGSYTVYPHDHGGANLLPNAEVNPAAQGYLQHQGTALDTATSVPAGYLASLKTTSATAGNVQVCDITPVPSPVAEVKGKAITVGAWLKIPSTNWTVQLGCWNDVDGGALHPVGYEFKDNAWHWVSFQIPVTAGSTALKWRVWVRPETGATGQVNATGFLMAHGNIGHRPAPAPQLLAPTKQRAPLVYVGAGGALQILTGSSQFDPTQADAFVVGGSGGPITFAGSYQLFSSAANWQDGQTVTLIGSSDTNTVTLTNFPSANCIALSQATRTLGYNDVLVLQFSGYYGWWREVSFRRAAPAYTASNQGSAYTGLDNAQAGSVYAKLSDINALRTAYETLRLYVEGLADRR